MENWRIKMGNIYDIVLDLLKKDKRFFSKEGMLLRNAVYEAAMKMDADLIKNLYKNKQTKKHFFTDVDGIAVFDKVGFGWVINNREFLPDSYTRYKNKIGLVNNTNNFISSSNDVVLDFPYKDCILEGGQTKEDQNRKEIFYNETLAHDEVDRLLSPKILCNAKRFSAEGQLFPLKFSSTDNIVIKGNNLLTLASLLHNYEGKIKCIYIDPPYNSGKKNSFGYNDSFNHSSWLSFMKTRLEYAKKLLSPDGCILIQTDDKEQAYLKVLCDEIFKNEQYETTFFVQVRFTNKTLAEDSTLHKVMETVHVYSKNHSQFRINKIKEQYSLDKFCWQILEVGKPQSIEINGKKVDIFKPGTYKIIKTKPNINGLKETWATGSLIRQGGTAAEFLAKYLIDRKTEDGLCVLYKVYNMGEDGLGFRYILGPQKASAFRGKFYSGVPIEIKEEVRTGQYDKEKPVPNIIYNYLSMERDFGNCRNEGGVDIEGGKKPEQLIKFFLDYFSAENDLVLDFFGGSGTTAAVAHKMHRRYITCEQLDAQIELIISRLRSVISGEKTGISLETNWKGGGSFVYCELAKLNQSYIECIQHAKDDKALINIWNNMKESAFISYKINPNDINPQADDFKSLSFSDKKKLLFELLDKNQLYINYCDIDDKTFNISKEDKEFTKRFYGEK